MKKFNLILIFAVAVLHLAFSVAWAQQTIKLAGITVTWSKRSSTQTDFTLSADIPTSAASIANAYIAVGFNTIDQLV